MVHSSVSANRYQKRINTQIQQFEDQQAQQQKRQQLQFEQKIKDQQKQINDLKKQVSLKKQRQAQLAAQAAQSRFVPQPVSYASGGSCEAYRPLVARYSWNVSVAMAIMHAESGCNPTATSPTCDHGLMQVNCVHANLVGGNLALLSDPATNVRVAYQIYSGAGWSAWTAYTSGAYLRYI